MCMFTHLGDFMVVLLLLVRGEYVVLYVYVHTPGALDGGTPVTGER